MPRLNKAKCPYCGKKIAITPKGKLYSHFDPATHKRCVRSGGRPN